MLRRITEIWPNLLRGIRNDQEEANQLGHDEDSQDEATGEQLRTLQEQTKEIYKNEFWSRLVVVDSHQPDESQRWRVADDLSKEHELLFTIDEDELP